jgi:TPR repeat protein
MVGQGTAVNPALAIANFEKGCQGQNAASCWEAAQFYHNKKFGASDEPLALQRRQQACDLGLKTACEQATPPSRPVTP